MTDANGIMWCSTCGRETPEGVSECASCDEWWKQNLFPPNRHERERLPTIFLLPLTAVALAILVMALLS